MDYSCDGSGERKFTAAQIADKNPQEQPRRLKDGPLLHVSIGGAEDYRWY
jgi:hypothetical protein